MARKERQNVIIDESKGNIMYDEEDGCYKLSDYTQLKKIMKHERIRSTNSRRTISLDGDNEIIKKEMKNIEKIKKKQEKEFEQKMLYEHQLADIQARNDDK